MEPTVVGSWSKRSARAVTQSTSDDAPAGPRPQKRSKHRGSVLESSSGDEDEDELDTSDLSSIRDIVDKLQSNERTFHRAQEAKYESLKRAIVDMESRWMKEKYQREMSAIRRRKRELEKIISKKHGQLKNDLVNSTRQEMVPRESLTLAATPNNRGTVSSLPTPERTANRQTIRKTSSMQNGQPLRSPMAENSGPEDRPRLTAQQKGKQPARLSSPTCMPPRPVARSKLNIPFEPPQKSSSKRPPNTPTKPIVVNSSDVGDGDDENELIDDLNSLPSDPSQHMASLDDDGVIIWPAGVGIGSESIEIEMVDERRNSSDHTFPSPGQSMSPQTIPTGGGNVPVCPGPFRMTPSSQLELHAPQPERLLRKRREIDYNIRRNLGLSDDDMGGELDRWLSKPMRSLKQEVQDSEDESYRPETIPDSTAGITVTATTNTGAGTPRIVANRNNPKRPFSNNHLGPSLPGDSAPRGREGQAERLITNGRLIPLSDDSDSEALEEMDVDGPVQKPPTLQPPQTSGLLTRSFIQALGLPPPIVYIPQPILCFSRSHIQKAFGGRPRGTVTVVKQNSDRIFPVNQFLCINGKLNPYYPLHPGAHGAIFIFRTGVVPLNSEWAVFCSRQRVGTGRQETFEYVGNYVVKDISDLPYHEWMATSAKFKEGWASHIAQKAKAPKGWARKSLEGKRLAESTDQIASWQVRKWFDTAVETHSPPQHARLGRRILEFREYKRGLYDSLVRVRQQMDEAEWE